jgi:hypothetical protein
MSPRKAVIAQVLVYSLALLPILAGCGEPPPVDTSLLTGEPCEPPCWQGLVPGVSTEEEVDEFVRTSELVDQTTLFRGDITRGTGQVVGVSVQWWSRADMAGVPRQFGNDFTLEGGVLQYMTIFLDVEVTLEDLLERYGAPEKFTAWHEGVEVSYVRVTLYYPNHGFTGTLTISRYEPQLRPETEVLRVWYFQPAPLEEFLELSRDIGYPTVSDEVLQDWHGYGPIELIP